MKNLKYLLPLFLSIFIVSCSSDDEEISPEPTINSRLTIIGYIDGNNNLRGNLDADIREMVTGSADLSEDVNLVVFANLRGSKPCIYEMSEGQKVKVREWDSSFLTTNPDSILSVMQWIIDEYPALEYATFFGGHGTGGIIETDTVRTDLRAAYAYGWDYDSSTTSGQCWINTSTLAAVMTHLPFMKYIFFDCCLMQDIDVVDQFKSCTQYLISPVCETPAAGAPYELIVPIFSISNTEIMCDSLLTTYHTYCKEHDDMQRSICISAIRTSAVDALVDITKQAISEIKGNLGTSAVTFDDCIYYYNKDNTLYDLQSIFYEQNRTHGTLSDDTYQKFLNALNQCVFTKRSSTRWQTASSININFNDFELTDANYGGISISKEKF